MRFPCRSRPAAWDGWQTEQTGPGEAAQSSVLGDSDEGRSAHKPAEVTAKGGPARQKAKATSATESYSESWEPPAAVAHTGSVSWGWSCHSDGPAAWDTISQQDACSREAGTGREDGSGGPQGPRVQHHAHGRQDMDAGDAVKRAVTQGPTTASHRARGPAPGPRVEASPCLLYTSDAADETSTV